MMTCINTPSLMNNHKTGQIQVIFGPMFSGKTTELMRRMKRYLLANYKCLVIKYARDTRYDSENIASHDRQTLAAKPATKLHSLLEEAREADVIGVDEGQFFADVVEFCERMANLGKTVIVAALDGDFKRQSFGSILQLVPLAESVIKLTAVCMSCNGEGSFTKRKGSATEIEVIGGTEMYLAVCRACYKPREDVSPLCSPQARASNIAPSSADRAAVGRNLFSAAKALSPGGAPVGSGAGPLGDRTNTMDTSETQAINA